MIKIVRYTRLIMISIICIVVINYLFGHYDGKKYDTNSLDKYISTMCRIGKIPGVSMAVIDDDHEYCICEGYADKEEKLKVNQDTAFELASTTKAFTALGILLLEQEGKLDRKDQVAQYIPWFEPTYKGERVQITIEDLLCHTSGIPAWTISEIPIGTQEDGDLLNDTIRKIQSVKLDHYPGTVHNYATINYDVLALIIEKVSQEKYETYIVQNILTPLGMTNSYFRVDDLKSNHLSQGYRYAFLQAMQYHAPTFYGNTAAGYLVSTAEDLMLWLKAQMGVFHGNSTKSFVELQNAIIESHSYPLVKEQNYFAGWNWYDTFYCHAGNNPNFCSQVIIDRTEKKAVFVLSNVCGSSATMIADGVYRIIHGEKVKIGFWLDDNSMIDLISFIICLLEICFLIGGINRKKARVKKKWKAVVSGVIAVLIIVFPYIFHYNYETLWVWVSPCLLLAMFGAVISCLFYSFEIFFMARSGEMNHK